MKSSILTGISALAIGVMIAPTAAAQTQTSQSSSGISAEIVNLVEVSKVDDISLTQTSGEYTMYAYDEFCVTATGGSYSITFTGDGASGFSLSNTNGDELPYDVLFYNYAQEIGGNIGGYYMASGVPRPEAYAYSDCDSAIYQPDEIGVNASFEITIEPEDALAVPVGQYNGTLTILVSGE